MNYIKLYEEFLVNPIVKKKSIESEDDIIEDDIISDADDVDNDEICNIKNWNKY